MRLPQWRHQAMRIRRDLSGQWTSSECWHLEMKTLNTHIHIYTYTGGRTSVHTLCVIFLSLMMRHEWEAWDSFLLFRRELLNPGDNRGLWHERRYKYFYARTQKWCSTLLFSKLKYCWRNWQTFLWKNTVIIWFKKKYFLQQSFLFNYWNNSAGLHNLCC